MGKVVIAVLHCTKKQPQDVINRCVNIRDNGMYVNTTEYPAIPIALSTYNAQIGKCESLQGLVKAKGGKTATINRNAAIKVLFGMLSGKNLNYANDLYKDMPEELAKSGYPLSNQPMPKMVPDAPVMDRVEKGAVQNSCKIYLKNVTGGAQKSGPGTYYVYVSDDDDGTNIKEVLKETSKHKLLLLNLPMNKKMYIGVSKGNTAGESEISPKLKFMLY